LHVTIERERKKRHWKKYAPEQKLLAYSMNKRKEEINTAGTMLLSIEYKPLGINSSWSNLIIKNKMKYTFIVINTVAIIIKRWQLFIFTR
jgi:hypothetical protein